MPEIMSIEGLHGRSAMRNYDLPLLEGMSDYLPSTADLKDIAILGGVGAGAFLAGDLTNLLPATIGGYDTYPKYSKPLLRGLLGLAAHQLLRRYSPQAATVAAGLLVGSAIYQLAKPSLGGIEALGLGQAVKDGLGDILVESRPLLGQIPPEQLWGLGEVRQDPIAALPPSMGEIQQDQFNGMDDADDEFEAPPENQMAWLS